MRIVATADLHGHLPKNLPEGDVLLIAGDVCPVWSHNRQVQANWLRSDFSEWLESLDFEEIYGIAGNHDFVLQDSPDLGYKLPWRYLQDESAMVMEGYMIWGSPWTKEIGHWAFGLCEGDLAHKWDLIPDSTNILMTHGPAYSYSDKYFYSKDMNLGSPSLLAKINDLEDLKVFVCGHIHEGYGMEKFTNAILVNASQMDIEYNPVNKPWVIDL